MNNNLQKASKVFINSLGHFFSQPKISAACQIHPLSASISTYFSGQFSQEQYKNLEVFIYSIHSRLQSVENKYLDKNFYESIDGKRIIGKIFRSIVRDGRKEKIEAMSNLTINIATKSRFMVDEKEIYVDILDNLNVLQLSLLQRAVIDMRSRTQNKHCGFGWEILLKDYEEKGISKPLFLQSIKILESNGLVNENTVMIGEADKTHFVSDFGEQFYDFISNLLNDQSGYLTIKI
jgi:hypothetical protein